MGTSHLHVHGNRIHPIFSTIWTSAKSPPNKALKPHGRRWPTSYWWKNWSARSSFQRSSPIDRRQPTVQPKEIGRESNAEEDSCRRSGGLSGTGTCPIGRQMGPPIHCDPSAGTSTHCGKHEDREAQGHKSWQGEIGGPGSGMDRRHPAAHADCTQAGYKYPCTRGPATVVCWPAARTDRSQEPTTTEEAEDGLPPQLRFPSWCAQKSTSCWEEDGIPVSRSGYWRRRKWVHTTYPPAEEDEREWRLRWSQEKMLLIVTVLICLSAVCSTDLFTEDGVHITREGSSRIIESVWTALVVINPPPMIPMQAWVEEVRAGIQTVGSRTTAEDQKIWETRLEALLRLTGKAGEAVLDRTSRSLERRRRRVKRGLVDIIGEAGKALFGVATQKRCHRYPPCRETGRKGHSDSVP